MRDSSSFEIPSAVGKVIRSMRVYDASSCCRNVQIVFTDGTEIVVDFSVKTSATAQHYRSSAGEPIILHNYADHDAR